MRVWAKLAVAVFCATAAIGGTAFTGTARAQTVDTASLAVAMQNGDTATLQGIIAANANNPAALALITVALANFASTPGANGGNATAIGVAAGFATVLAASVPAANLSAAGYTAALAISVTATLATNSAAGSIAGAIVVAVNAAGGGITGLTTVSATTLSAAIIAAGGTVGGTVAANSTTQNVVAPVVVQCSSSCS